eukprot:TRINITY_DN18659_c1_g1_i1.p1 TRINITY_DN18659_c1_g1~~TRINITY_DN18659_c1_g1_i1.p1  ORF type:complete len:139 (-),score=17.17 TRINITY_DN18659_c1_g1_i1:377-793(-)
MQVRVPGTVSCSKVAPQLGRVSRLRLTRSTARTVQVFAEGKSVTKSEVASMLASEIDKVSQKQVQQILNGAIEIIMKEVADGNKVVFAGFGTFEPRQRAARKGVNPQTQKPMDIPETTAVGFKVGKTFKEMVKNGGES